MTAKLNRAARCAAAVLAVVAVGAGAAACGSSSGTPATPGATNSAAQASGPTKSVQQGSQAGTSTARTAQRSSQAGAAPARAAGQGSQTATVQAKAAQSGSRSDAVNATSATTSRCHTGDLGISWDSKAGGHPDMNVTYQQIATIRLTNTGAHTCTLYGFPGVSMISTSGETWDLVRSADKPSTVTLRPGDDTALITMDILPTAKNDPDSKPFVPSKVLVTPPNETTHVTLAWPYGGALLDQSGATRPGTFVNPVGIG
jgi:Protein of unknown function (DUF4232)